MCVISTPKNCSGCQVYPVLPSTGGVFTYDKELHDRSNYLPLGYVFSVRLYNGQFLHIREACYRVLATVCITSMAFLRYLDRASLLQQCIKITCGQPET